MDELRGLGATREALKKRGGELIAVCVGSAEKIVKGRQQYPDLPCVLAADPTGAAVDRLGIAHQNASTLGKKLAVPANFLIDKHGVVQWAHYARIIMDRPDPLEMHRLVERLDD